MEIIKTYIWRNNKIELDFNREFIGITVNDNARLTFRQLQILSMKSLGYSQQKIADELGVTLQTVKNHLQYAKTSNSNEHDQKPTVVNLLAICEDAGLLLPITLLGIESIAQDK